MNTLKRSKGDTCIFWNDHKCQLAPNKDVLKTRQAANMISDFKTQKAPYVSCIVFITIYSDEVGIPSKQRRTYFCNLLKTTKKNLEQFSPQSNNLISKLKHKILLLKKYIYIFMKNKISKLFLNTTTCKIILTIYIKICWFLNTLDSTWLTSWHDHYSSSMNGMIHLKLQTNFPADWIRLPKL